MTDNEHVSFEDFGLKSEILKSIQYAGFKKPSPIQAAAIPLILEGLDIVGQAHTGTGKTAAFGLPVINNMHLQGGVETLVIVPTRELANQVSDELFKYGKKLGVRTVTIYGGRPYKRQLDLVERGAQIVIATPGRLLDMLSKEMLKDFCPMTVILDEADEMLDMGFLEPIKEIFSYLPQNRQTLLFSATMPEPIKQLTQTILYNPETITITREETTNVDIEQEYYVIDEHERDDAIIRLLDAYDIDKCVLFCRTKSEVDRLSIVINGAGYHAKGLHGDMDQFQRDAVIKALKENTCEILVATDVAARGIHIENISHVFNYHIPFDPESYVHRIGRTGRAGKKGLAVTLVTPLEFKELQRIKAKVGTKIKHAYIPSKRETQKNQLDKLINSLKSQKILDEAHEIIDALGEECDQSQLIYKMASMLIQEMDIKGPNKIGLDSFRIKKLLGAVEEKKKPSNNRRPRRGGNRNSSRRGHQKEE